MSHSQSSSLSKIILQNFHVILLLICTCNVPFAITTSQDATKSASTTGAAAASSSPSAKTLNAGGGQEIFENDVFSSIMNNAAETVDGLTTDADGNIGSTNLVFQPASIDFKENAIGEPQSRVITVFNRHRNQSVVLGSISGNVPDFYTSWSFVDKVIPPEGNATFNIVFLPRKLGNALGLLMIHTSFGLIKYEVRGDGVECPYRLTPLINLKAPLNATISPEIFMYNYHSKPLQIVEVYSSGGAFQLELPSGKQEGPQALWEIPPFSMKSVIRVKFNGKTPGNHTAYVRIKISAANDPSLANRMLVVPIEVEIFSHTGVYSNTPFIDFGFLANRSTVERRNLSLFSSRKTEETSVEVKSWRVESEEPEIIKSMTIEVQKNQVTVVLDWSKITKSERFTGEIVLKTGDRAGDEYRIPFTGCIVKGSLVYDTKTLQFLLNTDLNGDTDDERENFLLLDSSPPLERTFDVTNNFSTPINVINLTTSDSRTDADTAAIDHIKITGFRATTILKPNETLSLFRISLVNIRTLLASNPLPLTFLLQLHTNISVYEIPLHIFNGRLKRLVPLEVTHYDGTNAGDDQNLNFGILPVAQPHRGLIAFVNPNPVPVQITNFRMKSADGTYMSVTLRGCGPHQMDKLRLCNKVEAGEWIVFEIAVKSQTVGNYVGKFLVTSEVGGTFMEEIVTPVKFTTAMGRLELDKDLLHFTECYPGKLCSLNLSAYSTFMKKMQVEAIQPETAGISYVASTEDSAFPEILPNVVTDIGRLYFNPKELCKNDCYTSFEILSNATAARWMSTLNNFNEYRKLDLDWLAYRQNLYQKAKKMLKTISFKLTTNTVKRHEFNASVNLIWPKFLPTNINFPTLQIDQEAVKFITIINPTDHLLLVHYVLHDVANHGAKIYTPAFVSKDCSNCTLTNGENVFSFLHEETEVFIQDIPPHSYAKIGIRFSSNEPGTYSTALYLRNNLTVVESVWITARAVQPLFKFSNRKSGSATPLIFEVTDNHLKACDKPQTNYNPFVTIKRTFTAKNFGEVPITVYGLRVENNPCEGFGFKILNCHPFELAPNASEKIEIEFSPDFTLARLTRTLFLHTSMNYLVNFTLLGTVPPYALEKCNKAIIRPSWENNYRRITFGILTFAFLLVILLSFLESDKVLRDHLTNISKDRGPVQAPLDLRQIAASMQQETQALNAAINASATNSKKETPVVSRRKNAKSAKNDNSNEVNHKNGRYANSNSAKKQETNNNRKENVNNKRQQQKQEKQQRSKEIVVEAEETSSTTTESSFNSDDSDSRSTTRSSPKSDSPLTTDAPNQGHKENGERKKTQIAQSNGNAKKNNVKKSKSLPLQYEESENLSKTCSKDEQNEQINAHSKENLTHENGKELLSSENCPNDSSNQKLPGKTPGRERKSGGYQQSIKNSTNIKQLSFKTPGFGFETAQNSVPKNNHVGFLPQANIWTENRATFSDVVAQQPVLPVTQPKKSLFMDQVPPQKTRRSTGDVQNTSNLGLGGGNLFNQQQNANVKRNLSSMYGQQTQQQRVLDEISMYGNTDDAKNQRHSDDFGPIGTPLLTRNSPPFLQQNWEPMGIQQPVPAMSNYYQSQPRSRFLDTFQSREQQQSDASLLEAMSQFPVWNADPNWTEMFTRHQQQQQQQEQFDAWNRSMAWNPMNYSTNSTVRPPPGLTLNRERQQQLPGSHISNIRSEENVGVAAANQQQQQQQQQNQGAQQNQEPMRTYDPFKSLSYLWQGGTDLWGASSSNNNKKQE
ncbi:transmembrane protein 131 homolog [Culicoides brevitarsis]|uniref:transmembrane protein 131 homolog n=1 Tax=Culicoides brevitarsis TaxID=469753 RepID=UPI00307C4F5C